MSNSDYISNLRKEYYRLQNLDESEGGFCPDRENDENQFDMDMIFDWFMKEQEKRKKPQPSAAQITLNKADKLLSSDAIEDLEYCITWVKPFNREKLTRLNSVISKLYRLIHSHNTLSSCHKYHEDWREESELSEKVTKMFCPLCNPEKEKEGGKTCKECEKKTGILHQSKPIKLF